MFAKLTLYLDHLAQEISQDTPQPVHLNELHNWQLTAENLTTGKMIDLLVYLDELGFLSVGASPAKSE